MINKKSITMLVFNFPAKKLSFLKNGKRNGYLSSKSRQRRQWSHKKDFWWINKPPKFVVKIHVMTHIVVVVVLMCPDSLRWKSKRSSAPTPSSSTWVRFVTFAFRRAKRGHQRVQKTAQELVKQGSWSRTKSSCFFNSLKIRENVAKIWQDFPP